MKINIGQKEVVHFIGMGGIGMSGLAQIMKIMGFKVQGSDININKNIENCKKHGIKFFLGQKKKNIKDATILVKSSAIKSNNQEVRDAKRRKLPVYERVEMLSNIVSLKKNIIISGSHGKTTTTSLVSKILLESKLDPTIINGGVINSIKNNAKLGKGEWAVLEADESDGSFLKLPINYSIVTNIDDEHIDYYKNYKNFFILNKEFLDAQKIKSYYEKFFKVHILKFDLLQNNLEEFKIQLTKILNGLFLKIKKFKALFLLLLVSLQNKSIKLSSSLLNTLTKEFS